MQELETKASQNPSLTSILPIIQRYREARKSIEEQAASSAALRLAYNNKVELKAGEDSELLKATLELTEKNPLVLATDPEFAALTHQRDQSHVLRMSASAAGPVSFVSVGSIHDLRQEVIQNNRANPDNQIGLLHVRPTEIDNYLYADHKSKN